MHLSEVNKKKTIIGSQRLRHNQGAPSAEIQGGGVQPAIHFQPRNPPPLTSYFHQLFCIHPKGAARWRILSLSGMHRWPQKCIKRLKLGWPGKNFGEIFFAYFCSYFWEPTSLFFPVLIPALGPGRGRPASQPRFPQRVLLGIPQIKLGPLPGWTGLD